jgi:hypothetical protein
MSGGAGWGEALLDGKKERKKDVFRMETYGHL